MRNRLSIHKHLHRHIAISAAAATVSLGSIGSLAAQQLDAEDLSIFNFRAVGPTATGGRIVDIAVPRHNTTTIYAAAASGGLWRSVNNGTTWDCIFENESSISIGDIALDPNNEDVIWLGSGEANNQRSSYWGTGVFKSTDGGASWRNMGLRDSHHVGRIVVHPENSNTVYVATPGHLYTSNPMRGLYKTTDGGQSWEHVLYISDEVGVIDVAIDPKNPETLYAASYERLRRAWDFDGAGPGSAIYKSTDGGANWTKLEGGLPTGEIGRIGLAIYAANPQIIYASVSNQNVAQPEEESDGDASEQAEQPGVELTEPGPQQGRGRRGGPIGGEIYRSEDGGATWTKTNTEPIGGTPAYYYGQIRVDPTNDQRIYELSVPVYNSDDGGATWARDFAAGLHVDHHALWINPDNPKHLILGNDGGLHATYDRGATWDSMFNISLSQFYAITADMQEPYHIYGGLQDNGSWGGPSNAGGGGVTRAMWYNVGGGDGFYVQVDPHNHNIVFSESQFGAISKRDRSATSGRGGGFGFGSIRPPQSDPDGPRDRYNWMSPILMSAHNSHIIYFGGNKLFKSYDRGDNWHVISPDLSTADPDKLDGNVPHCTITTVAESVFDPGVLLVGTDDGNVQWSNDHGLSWTNMADRFGGVPANWWVSRVVLSKHNADRAYVTFTGYREDDFRPFVFVTNDRGATWEPITGNLPSLGSVNVIQEDPGNEDLLYVGTETGVYVSLNRGETWVELTSGFPTLPAHDLVIHPRDRDMIVGTHGRGMFIVDVSVLQQLTADAIGSDVHMFEVEQATLWSAAGGGGIGFGGPTRLPGDRQFIAPDPAPGSAIGYWLGSDVDGENISLVIKDADGEVVRTLEADGSAGLHQVQWEVDRDPRPGQQRAFSFGGRRFGGARRAPAGEYTAVLTVNGEEHTQTVTVRNDPRLN